MNKVILCGRLVRDPEVRYTQGANSMAVARYTLAVDRKFKKEGEPNADFIKCICFGKTGQFAELHLHQGMKMLVVGSWQTGSYTNKDGQKVYTNDCIVSEHYFCEGKNEGNFTPDNNFPVSETPKIDNYTKTAMPSADGFINIPENISDELPFT